ncbi:MAG: CIA30 family protein [Cyanobacteria bacterium P01_F01_bin.53]
MKLVLKILGLIGLIAAFWWFYTASSEPRTVAQTVNQSDAETDLIAPQKDSLDASQNPQSQGQPQEQPQGELITTFDTAAEAERWRTVNDNVMGGISQSTFVVTPAGTGIFQGATSLENNGGFSSVRRASADHDFTGAEAISVRVKGDGRRYQLRLRMDDSSRSIAYRAEFETRPDEWQTVRVRFQDFEPVFRGRIIADAPAIAPTDIQQIGFLIADKQSGEFSLETDWIQIE